MAKWLKIIKNGKIELVEIKPNQPLKLILNKDIDYQILDENGNPIDVKLVENGTQVEVYLPNQEQPIAVLQNNSEIRPLVNSENAISLSDISVSAIETNTVGISLSTFGYIGGGLLAAGGIALAAGGSGGSKGGSSAPQPRNEPGSSNLPSAPQTAIPMQPNESETKETPRQIEQGNKLADVVPPSQLEQENKPADVVPPSQPEQENKLVDVEPTHQEDKDSTQIEQGNNENLSRQEQFSQRMLNAILKGKASVDVSDLNISQTTLVKGQDYLYASDTEYKNWYDSFKINNPFLFHLDYIGEYSRQYKPENPDEVKAYNIGYTIPIGQIDDYYAKIEKSLQRYLDDLKEGMSEADIAYSVYNRLVKEVFYQQTENAFNAIGALVDQKAVCEGYSSAYRFVMNLLGIETQMVISGVLPNSSVAHVWNRIKIDGQWYNIDATWDDNTRQLPFALGRYFLTSDDKFYDSEDHPKPLEYYQLPAANSTRFDGAENAFFRNNLNQTDATFHNGYWYFIDKSTKTIMRAKIGQSSEVVYKIDDKMHHSEIRFQLNEGKITFVDFDKKAGQYVLSSIDYQGQNLQREEYLNIDDVTKVSLGRGEIAHSTEGSIALKKALALAKIKEIYAYREDDYFNPKEPEHIALRKTIVQAEVLLSQNAEPEAIKLLTDKLNLLRKEQSALSENTDTQPPLLTFDKVTGDDIINAEEEKQSLVVSGKVQNLQENDRLLLKIGEMSYLAAVKNGEFTANVDGKTLAVHRTITAEVVRGETKVSADGTHSVEVKTDIPTKPTLNFETITGDNIINREESFKENIEVSGSVENANESDEVIVSCGCPTCTGVQWIDIVTTVKDGKFSVNFAGNQLVREGYTIVKAKVITADQYGNKAIGIGEQSYTVDIEPPEPSVTFNPISPINAFSPNNINVSGRVINLKSDETGLVTATIGNQTYSSEIKNGEYSFNVPKNQFEGGSKVALRLNVRDKAGNIAELTESSNSQDQHYVYDVTLYKPVIKINDVQKITEKQPLVLSGTLSYDSDVLPSSVNVIATLNGNEYKAALNGNDWFVHLPASPVGKHNVSVKAEVMDKAGNRAENIAQSTFTVENPPEPPKEAPNSAIKITEVDFNPSEMVRLTGKVELDGFFAKYHNPAQLQSIIMKLNEKIYHVGVGKNQTFYLDIPLSDLQNAHGKTIEFQNKGGVSLYYLDENSSTQTAKLRFVDLPQLETSKYVWDKNAYIDNNHRVNSQLSEKTTQITGEVSGKLEGASRVNVKVGDQQFVSNIEEGKFTVSVPTALLKQNTTQKVIAELEGREEISDEYSYSSGRTLLGDVVITPETSNPDKPYFIKALEWVDQRSGYLKKLPIGKGGEITYSFNKEFPDALKWTQNNRNVVREALDTYEHFTNLTFKPMTDNYYHPDTGISADIQFYHRGLRAGVAGNAHFGGMVSLSSAHFGDMKNNANAFFTVLHEIGHSLGAKHGFDPINGVVLPPKLEEHKGFSIMSYTGSMVYSGI
ncbi:transglutaminase domain-containing protein [Mannheimia indoligenes]|uniref:transglutaminase domain-containing protein n=1 Tax=Mannheimia indoligenes TaxID=3103145 RepID=UPI002FE61F1D